MRTLGEQMTFTELPGVLGSVELNPQGPGLSIIVPVFPRKADRKQTKHNVFFCSENNCVPSFKNRYSLFFP